MAGKQRFDAASEPKHATSHPATRTQPVFTPGDIAGRASHWPPQVGDLSDRSRMRDDGPDSAMGGLLPNSVSVRAAARELRTIGADAGGRLITARSQRASHRRRAAARTGNVKRLCRPDHPRPAQRRAPKYRSADARDREPCVGDTQTSTHTCRHPPHWLFRPARYLEFRQYSLTLWLARDTPAS